MDGGTIVLYAAALIALATLAYVLIGWRGSPHALRTMLAVGGASAVAGLLGGLWLDQIVRESVSASGEAGEVVYIVDGDTFDLKPHTVIEGDIRVRPVGINSPEIGKNCFASEATQRASELLRSKKVRVNRPEGVDNRDLYGRLLRYVWLPDGRMFNLVMVEEGYACAEKRYPHPQFEAFIQAEEKAKADGRGLWGACGSCDVLLKVPAP